MLNITLQISLDLNIQKNQAQSAINLLNEGCTVPFIARYRKEATNNLDDVQLRNLQEKLIYYTDLEQRKLTILSSIQEQNKLTDELNKQINQCLIKQNLEDIYLPFKPKRRTKAQIAIENGLEPLAYSLLNNHDLIPHEEALKYLNSIIVDTKLALEGARDILAEKFAQTASLLDIIRKKMWQHGFIISKIINENLVLESDALTSVPIFNKLDNEQKFKDYYNFSELLCNIPSHRLLAILRGRNLGILNVNIEYDPKQNFNTNFHAMEEVIVQHFDIKNNGKEGENWLKMVCKWTWRVKLNLSIELELINQAKEQAEKEAINIFAQNLKQILMSAPAGAKVTMGLDPGIRTGVKVAIIDTTGKFLSAQTIYPHAPKDDWQGAINSLEKLINTYNIELIAIGNGTASRETDKLILEIIQQEKYKHVQKIIVNEAGASIYSASALASTEFPELDVALRGAVSIARRLQDPLAELVKIAPESIGVGQYQHDVNAKNLNYALNNVVEDCVNAVGVDINTASPALLEKISGLNTTLAKNIVAYRDEYGRFTNRQQLKKVARLGEKIFEQSAGFLRINNGEELLDSSSIHPESYGIANKILSHLNIPLEKIMGNNQLIKQIDIQSYIDEKYGKQTLIDILKEFEKPARDPRPSFKTANLAEGINEISDLKIDMLLEGTITNVTAFGAFVDIGVHQDGLVHISELTDKFVNNAQEVVQAGQIVKVKVLDVDIKRKRIALSMRLNNKKSTQNIIAKDKNEILIDKKITTTLANAFNKLNLNK